MPSTASGPASSKRMDPAGVPPTAAGNPSTSTQTIPPTPRSAASMDSGQQQQQPPLASSSAPSTSTPSATASSRWESLYVYAFLIKFLPPTVNDLYDAIGFEEALLSHGFNQIIFDILAKFLLQLKPQMEDPITPENITEKLQQIIAQFSKGRDRTVWWNESTKTNVHPFNEDVADFFELPWQDKLVIFRQLVDWQLSLSSIKDVIDVAWDVTYQRKKKKTNKTVAAEFAPPDDDDPMSMAKLQMVPIGQDAKRIRYWMVDNSPRVWSSPNPFRMNCPITPLCSNRNDFIALVKSVRESLPPVPAGVKRSKYHNMHLDLIIALEQKLPLLDDEERFVKRQKAKRALQVEREEMAKLVALQEEERRKLEIGSRTRSKTKPDVGDESVDEQDDNAEASSSTTVTKKSKAKPQRTKNAASKKNSKKRKRQSSPEAEPENIDEIDELANDDEDNNVNSASDEKPVKKRASDIHKPIKKGKSTSVHDAIPKDQGKQKRQRPRAKDHGDNFLEPANTTEQDEDQSAKRIKLDEEDRVGASSAASGAGEEAPIMEQPTKSATTTLGVDTTARSKSTVLRHAPLNGRRRSSRLAKDDISADDITITADIPVPPGKAATVGVDDAEEEEDQPPKKRAKLEAEDDDDTSMDDAASDVPTSTTAAASIAEVTMKDKDDTMVPTIAVTPAEVPSPPSTKNSTIVNGWAIQPDPTPSPERPAAKQPRIRV